MKYKKITVITSHEDADMIASVMFDAGADGVEIFDAEDFKELVESDVIWDYADENLLSAASEVRVSCVIGKSDEIVLKELYDRLEGLRREGGIRYGEITVEILDESDWANEWKKYYSPIKTKNITIVPTWIDYRPDANERVIRLDPGMAFGTGSHATTAMCLDLAEAEGKSVIDVGCGSGILGISAAVCGAKSVYMCDIDPQAVQSATKNAEINEAQVEIERADLINGERKADLIFANLTADILCRLAGSLDKHLNAGGELIASGIIAGREGEVEACFSRAGFEAVERMQREDWRAFRFIRKYGA